MILNARRGMAFLLLRSRLGGGGKDFSIDKPF